MPPDFTNVPTFVTPTNGQSGNSEMEWQGECYLVKYETFDHNRAAVVPGRMRRNSPVSEWLGCQTFRYFGVKTQEVVLGTCNGRPAAACKLFVGWEPRPTELLPFQAIRYVPSYESASGYPFAMDVLEPLEASRWLEPIREEAVEQFCQMLVVDTIIGNYVRNGLEWGFIRDRLEFSVEGMLETAPVYDCGSSFFVLMSGESMEHYLAHPGDLRARLAQYPKLPQGHGKGPIPYREFLLSPAGRKARKVLLDMAPRIADYRVGKLVEQVPFLDKTRRDFYELAVDVAVEEVLRPAYLLACQEHGVAPQNIVPGRSGSS